MTKSGMPRIQFRLSKQNDEDLIRIFQPIQDNPDGDVTAEAKRLIRLGCEYESFLKGQGAIIVREPKTARLSPLQQNFIQITQKLQA